MKSTLTKCGKRGYKMKWLIVLQICYLCLGTTKASLNYRPIIGVLSQSVNQTGASSNKGETFILLTYIQYLEMAGARVVPIKIGECKEYYETLFKSLNGVLFPGGNVSLIKSGYACEGKLFYELAIEANKRGDYFPIWGTCQGFELLSTLTPGRDVLIPCHAWNIKSALNMSKDFRDSRLYRNIDDATLKFLTKEETTPNFHNWCLTPENFNLTPALKSFYRVISTNKDRKGKEYISTMEAYNYPFYGTQWHPEKNNFAWTPSFNVDHSIDGVKVGQYMANFFVNEARKSQHKFLNVTREQDAFIYNYRPEYVKDGQYNIRYIFDKGAPTPECSVDGKQKPAIACDETMFARFYHQKDLIY
ncbi:unnamed protein product [Owenia fusiformis]|uniref:folate gamma-glutamyl hydrolase n=1 Tax=Owenia fusiformis TaxID=6347 RepID=A0A8J1Y668_OWEFU|nr:unnamed protein product [Owenia fusiformis]